MVGGWRWGHEHQYCLGASGVFLFSGRDCIAPLTFPLPSVFCPCNPVLAGPKLQKDCFQPPMKWVFTVMEPPERERVNRTKIPSNFDLIGKLVPVMVYAQETGAWSPSFSESKILSIILPIQLSENILSSSDSGPANQFTFSLLPIFVTEYTWRFIIEKCVNVQKAREVI